MEKDGQGKYIVSLAVVTGFAALLWYVSTRETQSEKQNKA